LRRFLDPVTAWGLATLVAVSATLIALYALERAYESPCRRWLGWHFAALYVAILAEFGVAWVVLAAGIYGVVRFWKEPAARQLLPRWVLGQLAAAGIYVWLFLLVVRPVWKRMAPEPLITAYLHGSFPSPEQSLMGFLARGVLKQFSYIAGGIPAGLLALVLAAAGLACWYRRGDRRIFLVVGVYLTAAGALLRFFPFGRTRHSVLVGLIGLAAVGAGIDWVARWRPLAGRAVLALLLVLGFAFPLRDETNIWWKNWEKARLDRALERTMEVIPAGESLLTDDESVHMLRSRYLPRGERREYPNSLPPIAGHPLLCINGFEWSGVADETIRRAFDEPRKPKWILDMGFGVESLRTRAPQLGVTPIVDEPGVLFLGRVP
jgi:hypothetical protein